MVSFAGSDVADQLAGKNFPSAAKIRRRPDPGLFVDPQQREHNAMGARRELGNAIVSISLAFLWNVRMHFNLILERFVTACSNSFGQPKQILNTYVRRARNKAMVGYRLR